NLASNIAVFIGKLKEGEASIKVPYAQEVVIVYRQADGSVFATEHALQNLRLEEYVSAQYKTGERNISYVSLKRFDFGEYMKFLVNNVFAVGPFVGGLVLFLLGIYLVMKQGKEQVLNKNILNDLKVLRVLLAVGSIIPKESAEEAKKIIERIMKEAKL
ncbi:MAG: hypothetical protein D6699_00265, partial [Aquificota bacterium]